MSADKNNVLMVALDFPPCQSAGVQRTLKFCEQLPEHNWNPIVLTAKSYIYDKIDNTSNIAPYLESNTYRAFGLNSLKHLSIKGKYLAATAQPDPYSSWYIHSVILGKKIIKKEKPKVIWSTHPCLTAHKIASTLKKYSGLPWVADYRDPFKGHQNEKFMNNKSGYKIDKETVQNADLLVFATGKMAELYKQKYPHINSSKFLVIENGYNEDVFHELNDNLYAEDNSNIFTLLHSGEIYENGRDPASLFKAISMHIQTAEKNEREIKVIFRGAKINDNISNTIRKLNIENNIEFLPAISYKESIREMLKANALLVIQGSQFNVQIPGKIYEYIRAKKPILGILDESGATAELLKNIEHGVICNINDKNSIAKAILKIKKIEINEKFNYKKYDRKKCCEKLSSYFNEL